jgi:type II secretory pathway component GspD/PulD (secretin)
MTSRDEKPLSLQSKKLSVVADSMRVGDFARLVATEAEVSVVVEESLDDRTVSIEIRDEPIDVVIGYVARRLGVEMSRAGNLYFLGAVKPEDKGVLVRRVSRLPADQVKQAIATLATEASNMVVDVDGLCVVSDRIEVLRRVHDMIDAINSAQNRTWVVQLYLVGLSQRAVDDLGVQFDPRLSLGATLSVPGSTGLTMEAALDAVLQYEQVRSDVDTVASPTFVLRDGVASRVFVGDRIPVPRRAISDQGTSTVQGFDQVEAGLSIECEVREAGTLEAILRLAIERSRIKGFVEGSPAVGTENFETQAVVGRSGVYMLGELCRSDSEQTEGGNFRFGSRESQSFDVIQFWARVDTVGSDITGRQDLVSGPQSPAPDLAISSPAVQREASPAAMSGNKNSGPRSGSASGGSNVGANVPPAEPSTAISAERGPTLIPPATTSVAPEGAWRSVPQWPPAEL